MAWIYRRWGSLRLATRQNRRPRSAGPSVFRGADIRQGRNRGDPDVPVGYRRRDFCGGPSRFLSLCDAGRHRFRRVQPGPGEMQYGSALNCALRPTIHVAPRGTVHPRRARRRGRTGRRWRRRRLDVRLRRATHRVHVPPRRTAVVRRPRRRRRTVLATVAGRARWRTVVVRRAVDRARVVRIAIAAVVAAIAAVVRVAVVVGIAGRVAVLHRRRTVVVAAAAATADIVVGGCSRSGPATGHRQASGAFSWWVPPEDGLCSQLRAQALNRPLTSLPRMNGGEGPHAGMTCAGVASVGPYVNLAS